MSTSTKYRRRFDDPTGSRFGMPTYGWNAAPSGLATRRQLCAMGLQPARQRPVGQILWARGRAHHGVAYLYAINAAKPKKPATPGQLKAVAAMMAARSTCSKCGTNYGHCLPRSWAGVCWQCDPENEVR